jgi:hypothetical protein
VPAVVEELLLEPRFANEDPGELKRKVSTVMTSGPEFLSTRQNEVSRCL